MQLHDGKMPVPVERLDPLIVAALIDRMSRNMTSLFSDLRALRNDTLLAPHTEYTMRVLETSLCHLRDELNAVLQPSDDAKKTG